MSDAHFRRVTRFGYFCDILPKLPPVRILFTTIALLLLISLNAAAQRKLPYPIILIHGFSGGASNWFPMKQYLANELGLSIEGNDLAYCLNADGNPNTSNKYKDVYPYNNSIGNRDVYTVNFDVCLQSTQSNQSGAVKQGYALGFAVEAVLRATGALKVILFGHSMGGLAAREYLQNSENWPPDRQHHVAKLVTLGTPHQGSDLGSADLNLGAVMGYDESSEAVRDLRSSYKSGSRGVYLYGGYESSSIIQRGFGSSYYNIDVNSNGYTGDLITGLNQKDIRVDLAFSSVIGTGVFGLNGDSDGVVLSASQDLNKVYNIGAETFYYRCPGSLSYKCHTGEPEKAIFESLYALDEPGNSSNAYRIELNRTYQGTFTIQPNLSFEDRDRYRVNIAQRGQLRVFANAHSEANAKIEVRDPSGVIVGSTPNSSQPSLEMTVNYNGEYLLDFNGNSGNGWRGYGYSTSFCPLPPVPALTVAGPTTFCEGQNIALTTGSGYDSYRWYRNGELLSEKSNRLSVNSSGQYRVEGIGCGIVSGSGSTVAFTAVPPPPKPSLTKRESADSVTLAVSGNEQVAWYRNGAELPAENSRVLLVDREGSYHAKASNNGCSSFSDTVSVRIEKPVLFAPVPASFCEGDSLLLTAPAGFGTYVFSDGNSETVGRQNSIVAKSRGNYSVRTLRGKLSSPPSDPVLVSTVPLPPPAAVRVEGNKNRCDNEPQIIMSATPGYDEYRWYKDGALLSNTEHSIKDTGSGRYSVQGVKCGKVRSSGSDALVTVNALPPKPALTRQEFPDSFLLNSSSSENIRWLRDGVLLPGISGLSYTPSAFGVYAVQVSRNGCASQSDTVSIKIDKPRLSITKQLCEGDSTQLAGPSGFGSYVFSDGKREFVRLRNTLTISAAGTYTVKTLRGKLSSTTSDPVSVASVPLPPKPVITLEGNSLKSSSLAGNQWYLNGGTLQDSTRQHLGNPGGGAYKVRVTESGCQSDSEPFVITSQPQAEQGKFKVYPNPTTDGLIWIELPEGDPNWELDVYDMTGRMVGSQHIKARLNRLAEVRLLLVPGPYLLSLQSSNGKVFTSTLLIQ